MKITLSLFWTLVALAFGTTAGMGQTNVFHSGNPKIDAELRQFEFQAFYHNLPPKIQFVTLQRNVESLTLWVEGLRQYRPNEPDKLGGLDLQVWLLCDDGTAVTTLKKPWLERGPEPSSFGNSGYSDSMVYTFTRVPLNEITGVVIRAQGKLYCYQVDQQKWQK